MTASADERPPWAPFGVRPRVARPASRARLVTMTLLQALGMWAFFYALLPWGVLALEEAAGGARLRFDGRPWIFPAAALFVAGGTFGLSTGVLLAVGGEGTPFPLTATRRLVIAGPYRHVRNPMAIASFAQGAAVGLALGSPAVLLYVALGIFVWNRLARPWEEADLLARFGDEYATYRRRVRCWRIRRRPYDPARESEEPPMSAARTTPPPRPVVLYDGACRLCIAASARLVRLGRPGTIERRSFRDPGVLDAFPGVTPEACERAMHLVLPDGRVFAGAEAVARALATRPLLGLAVPVYRLPGVRLLCDVVYGWVARNRLRWFGAPSGCDDAACRLR